jgi:heat-inducible transcriptional repressor
MEQTGPALTQRQERILRAVCRDYILHGKEVASAGLVDSHGLPWSSATVRQELAVLEQLGFLERPHRKSGRIPTPAGMQQYVATLPANSPAPELARAVDRSLRDSGHHLERDLRSVSCLLAEVAGCVAVSFWGSARHGVIEDVDVVPLVGERALVVMTLDDRSTMMQPVTLDRLDDSPADLSSQFLHLQSRLRSLCRGRTLADARTELSRRQEEEETRLDRMLAQALRVGMTLCAEASLDPLTLQLAGQPLLARELAEAPEFSGVLALLEDYHRLAHVLCQLLPEPQSPSAPRADVRFGVERLPSQLTVVGCRLVPHRLAEGRATGAIALLGSRRMDYASVIPLVEYAARTLAAHSDA